jgi:hypothetical protein
MQETLADYEMRRALEPRTIEELPRIAFSPIQGRRGRFRFPSVQRRRCPRVGLSSQYRFASRCEGEQINPVVKPATIHRRDRQYECGALRRRSEQAECTTRLGIEENSIEIGCDMHEPLPWEMRLRDTPTGVLGLVWACTIVVILAVGFAGFALMAGQFSARGAGQQTAGSATVLAAHSEASSTDYLASGMPQP